MNKKTQKAPDAWRGFHRVIVGVADLDVALDLWHDQFGLELLARFNDGDVGLDALWQLDDNRVTAQALLRTPGQSGGAIHLVQFQTAPETVRDGAEPFDSCPKNLDVHVRRINDHAAALRRAGYEFRTDEAIRSTAPDGTVFSEIHMPTHDDINVVLMELESDDIAFTPQGYAAVSPLISVVEDAEKEQAFYRDVLGLTCESDNILEGAEIEKMIGLPQGCSLDVSIWGAPDVNFGQLEIVSYRGAEGNDLYARTAPPARGILRIALRTAKLDDWRAHFNKHGVAAQSFEDITLRVANSDVLVVSTPGGLVIELHQFKA